MEDNSNNGLVTDVWGPAMWRAMHSITFGYPKVPTDEQKQEYKQYFTLIGKIMPCRYCRDSYSYFIKSNPTILDDSVMESRETLTKWLYKIHERVNEKLGKTYGKTYEDVVEEYEKYRAKCSKSSGTKIVAKGCKMPLGDKKETFITASIKDFPIIPLDIVNKFINYAKERNINDNEFKFYYFITKNPNVKPNDRHCNEWCTRNEECSNIREHMRKEAIPPIESNGQYNGLPTEEELKMILRLSTTMALEELKEISNKLENKISNSGSTKYYKFTK